MALIEADRATKLLLSAEDHYPVLREEVLALIQ